MKRCTANCNMLSGKIVTLLYQAKIVSRGDNVLEKCNAL